MPVRSRLLLPGALALMLLLPACILFPFPPFGGQADLVIENATEEPWVLRVVGTDGFPQDFAVPAAVRRGHRQLERYREELQTEFPGAPWTTRIETYEPLVQP